MKTLTICGSMRFSNEMCQIAWELETMHGFNILKCVYGDDLLDIQNQYSDLLLLVIRSRGMITRLSPSLSKWFRIIL